MNRNRRPHNFAAEAALTAIPGNGSRSRFEPAASAIGCLSADPRLGLMSNKSFGRRKAIAGAKARRSVLSNQPRFSLKTKPAVFAFKANRFDPFWVGGSSNLSRRERVSRAHAHAIFVPETVRISHFSNAHMPASAARSRAESRFADPVRFNKKRLLTNLAIQLYHGTLVAQLKLFVMGTRTTDIAEKRIFNHFPEAKKEVQT